MTDLETRVREALADDPVELSADDVLAGVRRGASTRRTRRLTGVIVAAAVVLAGVGGGIAHHDRAQTADHGASPDHVSGTFAVAITGTGTVFKVVANHDCDLPCSTVWKQDHAGGWTRLTTIHDASQGARFFGPVLAIQMSPDGRDGWMWGMAHVWSTHDAGATWTRLDVAPFAGADPWDEEYLDLVPGTTYTYATVTRGGHRTLWRTPTDGDRWTQVSLPPRAEGNIAAVLPDSRIALQVWFGPGNNDDMRRVRRHGKVVRLVEQYDVGDGSGTWTRVQVPCVDVRLPTKTKQATLCGPGGRTEGAGGVTGPRTTDGTPRYRDLAIPIGIVGQDARNPVGHMLQLHITSDGTFLVAPGGLTRVDLHLAGLSRIYDRASQGEHAAFVDSQHLIHVTDDGGRTWRTLP